MRLNQTECLAIFRWIAFGIAFIFVACVAYLLTAFYVSLFVARRRAARLLCPECNSPIGHESVRKGRTLMAELERAEIAALKLNKNTSVDIHFRNVLPVTCVNCGCNHEFDLDELGIGPVSGPRRITWFLRKGLRHTFLGWSRGSALVQFPSVQTSLACVGVVKPSVVGHKFV